MLQMKKIKLSLQALAANLGQNNGSWCLQINASVIIWNVNGQTCLLNFKNQSLYERKLKKLMSQIVWNIVFLIKISCKTDNKYKGLKEDWKKKTTPGS